MLESLKQFDTSLFFLINRDLLNSLFDIIMPVITNRAYIIVLPFILLMSLRERKKVFAIVAVSIFSVLFADWMGNTLKHIIWRVRPCNALENVHLLAGCSGSPSMPSNHSTNSFAFAIPFIFMTKNRLRYIFLLVAALVAYSRVYVGVHYPFDVIAGAVVGSAASLFVIYLYNWAEERFASRPYTTVMSVFLMVVSIFRIYYILQGPLDLSPDEAHYWEWSRRLDLSYYSKGPMIAYLIALGTSLFGDNVFGVRSLAIVFSLLSSIVIYKLGKEMFGEMVGAFSAMLLQIIPLYSPFGIIFTIDSPFIFFWILSLYLFWKAAASHELQVTGYKLQEKINSENPPLITRQSSLIYWLLLGISIGLGLLTKYTMAFFYICAFFFFIYSAQHRWLLKTSSPYAALITSIVFFAPVIIWNSRHGWVTLRHTAGQAHVAEGFHLSPKDFFEFIGSQIGVITPVLFVLIFIALLKLYRISSESGDENISDSRGQFLFWFSIPVIIFFIIKSIQGKVQANWAMTGYITGIIAFSYVFLGRWRELKPYVKTTVIIALALPIIVTSIAHYPSKFIPPRLDPSARLRGWQGLAREVEIVYGDMLKNGNVFIFSDSYQAASELAFYVKGHPTTYNVNLGRRMNQYDLWPDFNSLIHYTGVFVTIDNVDLPAKIKNAFAGCEKHIYKAYEKSVLLREYSIFICSDFKGIKEERIDEY